MTDGPDLMRWHDDGGPVPPDDDPPGCCPAAAELAAVRGRAGAVMAGPWRGPETTAAKEAVRAVVGEPTEA